MKLMLFVLAGLVALTGGCASKPRFFQTQAEREAARQQTPEYKAQEAQWEAERVAIRQRAAARRQKYIDEHPELPPKIVEAIQEGGIVRGMNEEQAVLVLGRPDKMNKSTGAYGRRDQWVYGSGIYYLYFENGILDSWQSRE